jgi:hypothetical protein
MTTIDRRSLLTRGATVVGAAAVTAIPAVGLATVVKAAPGEDAELQQLWAEYLATLEPMRKAQSILSPARVPYELPFTRPRTG